MFAQDTCFSLQKQYQTSIPLTIFHLMKSGNGQTISAFFDYFVLPHPMENAACVKKTSFSLSAGTIGAITKTR